MQFIKFVFVLSSTTLIGTLVCQSSSAFTLTQSTSQMESFALSKLKDGGTGLTLLRVLDPDDPLNSTKSTRFVTEIERGGTKGLLSDLTLYTNLSRNPWTFNRGRDLQGRFNVKTHYACDTKTSCGTKKGGVGSVLRLEYIPEIRNIPAGRIPDPNPKQNKNLHWIQRVITNYPGSKKMGAFGNKRQYIDNLIEGTGRNSENPYYGTTPAHHLLGADGLFKDSPYRWGNLNRNFYWIGELYLAEANSSKPREVTIYNGVRWGWTYQYFPKGQPVRVPAFIPKPTQTPEIPLPLCPPNILTKSGSTIVANSSSGGGGIGCVAVSPKPSPTPRPTQSPTPRPQPSPTPRPTQSPTPSPIVLVLPAPSPSPWTPTPLPTASPWTPTPLPTASPWTASPWPTPAPWVSSPWPTPAPWASSPWPTPAPWSTSTLGSSTSTSTSSTSSTVVVVSTSKPSAAPSPSPKPSSLNRTANANRVFATDYVESELPLPDTKLDNTAANTDSDSSENIGYSSINNDATDLANISGNLLEDPELSSTNNNENPVDLASASSDLLEDPELSSTDSNENELDLAGISSDLLEDPELSSTDSNENELDLANISGDLLEDPELSSTDSNENELDLAGISSDLLEDPELASEDNNSLAAKTKNPDDDALPAEAVPEPTTGLGTLLALSGLGIFFKLKNRKTKE